MNISRFSKIVNNHYVCVFEYHYSFHFKAGWPVPPLAASRKSLSLSHIRDAGIALSLSLSCDGGPFPFPVTQLLWGKGKGQSCVSHLGKGQNGRFRSITASRKSLSLPFPFPTSVPQVLHFPFAFPVTEVPFPFPRRSFCEGKGKAASRIWERADLRPRGAETADLFQSRKGINAFFFIFSGFFFLSFLYFFFIRRYIWRCCSIFTNRFETCWYCKWSSILLFYLMRFFFYHWHKTFF